MSSTLSEPTDSVGSEGSSIALDVQGLTAGYGQVTVLRDVSLQAKTASVVALLGANGAGKTTLMRSISGLVHVSAGQVSVHGTDISKASVAHRARSGVCSIPSNRGIFRELTVRENLRLQQPRWVKANHTEEAVEAFPVLGRRMDQLAGAMSGGEQQMLSLARTFMAEPSVILLDEVSMGLAPIIVDQIYASLRDLAQRGLTLVLVEQYVERALELADWVVVLDRGTVAFSGPASAVDHDVLLSTYLGVELTDEGSTS